MRWFHNLRIGNKIIALVIVMSLFMGGVGYLGYSELRAYGERNAMMYNERLLPIEWLNMACADAYANATDLLRVILATDSSVRSNLTNSIQKRSWEFSELLSKFEQKNWNNMRKNNLI